MHHSFEYLRVIKRLTLSSLRIASLVFPMFLVSVAYSQTSIPAITLLLLDDESEQTVISADLRSLTRVVGVSPETVYFSADQSFDRTDSSLQHRYGRLAYHFDFDDPDSGDFSTTGNSKNSQVGGSPRAIHTFVCTPSSSRYDNGICTYNVGVRVQNLAGDFDDAFVTVQIEAAENHYAPEDTICVSTSNNFEGCNGQQVTQVPSIGEYSGRRVRFRRGDSFADACIGYQESGVLLDAFGSGSESPFLSSVRVGVDTSCADRVPNTTRAASYAPLTKDNDGHITRGWAYDITVTGLRLGSAFGGMATTLVTWHDLDLDWSENPAHTGEFELGNFGRACTTTADLDCSLVPYPYGVFLTDTNVMSHPDNLVGSNVNCYLQCGLINSGIAGVSAKTAAGHNFRTQGAWGLVISNVWFRGGNIGPNGPKHRATIRNMETGVASSLTANPEDFTLGHHLRTAVDTDRWSNRYNMILDSRFNEASQLPGHSSAAFIEFRSGHQYSGMYNNQFFDDPISSGAQIRLGGTNIFARDNLYNGVDVECRYDDTFANGTPYQRNELIFADSNNSCNTNVPDIASPSAPGT